MKKGILLSLLLILIALVYFFTPAKYYLSVAGFHNIEAWIQAQGFWAPVFFGLIYVAATVLALPGTLLTLGGGFLFGAAWGTVINLVSATIGALIAFWIARYFGRDFVAEKLKGKWARFDEKIEKHGFFTVLYLRLIPLFPFNVLNYSLGLTRLKTGDYLAASVLGMAPACFVYTSLGAAGKYIDWKNPQTWKDYHVWGPFLVVILFSILVRILKRKKTL